jgi:hypothetical protein
MKDELLRHSVVEIGFWTGSGIGARKFVSPHVEVASEQFYSVRI